MDEDLGIGKERVSIKGNKEREGERETEKERHTDRRRD